MSIIYITQLRVLETPEWRLVGVNEELEVAKKVASDSIKSSFDTSTARILVLELNPYDVVLKGEYTVNRAMAEAERSSSGIVYKEITPSELKVLEQMENEMLIWQIASAEVANCENEKQACFNIVKGYAAKTESYFSNLRRYNLSKGK